MHPREPGSTVAGPGGRLHARRALVATAFVLLAVSRPFVPVLAARAADGDPEVTVRGDRGLYSVAARFAVDASAADALAVLADFERIPEFMPDIRSSRVIDRAKGRVLVEQSAEKRVMLFSRRVHLVLEIREAPGALRFRDVCGRSFVRYQGAWRVEDVSGSGSASVTYELSAEPAFEVPGFLLRRLLERDARTMIERLRAEIAARTGSSAAGAAR